jgi:hypothetical protein
MRDFCSGAYAPASVIDKLDQIAARKEAKE